MERRYQCGAGGRREGLGPHALPLGSGPTDTDSRVGVATMPQALKIDIYTSRFNPDSIRAKGLLDRRRLEYNEFDVELDEFNRNVMEKRTGGRTSVPQIFINGRAIGGLEELQGFLAASGEIGPWSTSP